MCFVLAVVFAVILILVRKTDKSFINPITMTILLWLSLLTLYATIDHGLYALSDRFYMALLLWVFSFSVPYFLISLLPVNDCLHLKHEPMRFLYRKEFAILFSIAIIISLMLTIKEAYEFDLSNIFRAIRTISLDRSNGELEKPGQFALFPHRIAEFGYVLFFVYLFKNIKFKYLRLFQILVLFHVLMRANKFMITKVVIGIIIILAYKGKLKRSTLLSVIGGLFLLFILIQIFRGASGSEFSLLDFLYIYILSPLPAFDSYILNSNSTNLFSTVSFGEHTFANLLGDSSVNPDYFENENFVFVPFPTNVFTVMSSYFIDWRWRGIALGGFFFGLFFSYIYKRAKVNDIYKLLYASVAHIIVLQFFFDFLITQQVRANIKLMIVLFILFYPPVIYEKKKV